MKKTIMAVAILMGVSVATSTLANNGMKIVEVVKLKAANDLNIEALKGLKFRLSLDNTESRTFISLLNVNGDLLYSEITTTGGDYSKVFDLSNLADGNYSFVVRTGNDKFVKEFEIKTNVERSASF